MTGSMTMHRKTMTPVRMVFFGVSASGPAIVLMGGIPAAYAASGDAGLPLAFLLVGGILGLLTVGYVAMARRTRNPAVYYAVAARGLGRPLGVAAGMLALAAYNAILVCMFGFLGGILAGMLGGAWWVYAAVAWLLIGVLGRKPVAMATWALATILAFSAAIAVLFVIAALAHPTGGGFSVEGYSWQALHGDGLSAAVILAVACKVGYEGTASFGTEGVEQRDAGSATKWALGVLTAGYSLLAWAMEARYGVHQIAAAAADPSRGVPLDAFAAQYGWTVKVLALIVLIVGIVGTQLAVHAVTARYGYAMAKDGVLPRPVAFLGDKAQDGSPIGGSVLQTGISAVVIAGFAVTGADPLATLFPWGASVGALGVICSLVLASLAALVHLHGEDGPVWERRFAPALGVLFGSGLLVVMVRHSAVLVGAGPGSVLPVVIPGVLVAVVAAGLAWAWFLRAARPEVYEQIGRSRVRPLHAVPGLLRGLPL